jgi:hypothetical protein
MVFSMMFINTSRVQNRMRRVVGTQLTIGTLMIVLTVVLLPVLGVTGAAWAYLISEASGALIGAVPLFGFMRANGVHLFRMPASTPDDEPAADAVVDPGALAATTPMPALGAGVEVTVPLASVQGRAERPERR